MTLELDVPVALALGVCVDVLVDVGVQLAVLVGVAVELAQSRIFCCSFCTTLLRLLLTPYGPALPHAPPAGAGVVGQHEHCFGTGAPRVHVHMRMHAHL